MPSLWAQMLAADQLQGTVVVETDVEGRESPLAFGLTTFVNEPFIEEYLQAPVPHLSAVVYQRILAGRSPVLGLKDIAAANASGDLNLLILHFGLWHDNPTDERGNLIIGTSHTGFRTVHLGYRAKRILQDAYGPELPFFQAGGFLMKSDYRNGAAPVDATAADWRPYLMGLFRDDEQSKYPGSAISYLFHSPPPTFGFSESERRVLLRAMLDESDEAMAESLGVSHEAVKKTWRRIHQRVDTVAPDLLLQVSEPDGTASRGKDRRRKLLQYLRYHLEELRPFLKRDMPPIVR